MDGTDDNGLTAGGSQPVKGLSRNAIDFIALCARYATVDAATACAAVLMAAETIRLLVLGAAQ